MSKYIIEGDTLRDIADKIRLKRDIATEIAPEDMPLEISLIESGGGGGGAELLAERDYNLNLSADTTFDSITPTTSAQTIKANAADYIVYSGADLLNYHYYCTFEYLVNHVYKSTPTDGYAICTGGIMTQHLMPVLNAAVTNPTFYVYSNGENISSMTYMSSGKSPYYASNNSYGIYCGAPPISYIASGQQIKIGTGTVLCRGANNYAHVNALRLLDSPNITIVRKYKFWRMPVSGTRFERAWEILRLLNPNN